MLYFLLLVMIQSQQNKKKNTKFEIINSKCYKNLLTPAINELSIKIQHSNGQSAVNGNFIILNIENEALELIEQIILNLFNSILLVSCDDLNQSPESDAMRSLGKNSTNNKNENEIEVNSLLENKPIRTIAELEARIKQILPRSYSDDLCPKAQSVVDKCAPLLNLTKYEKILKTLQSSGSSNNELNQILAFPLERIHSILCKEIFMCKIDTNITIYLLSILELITKDILYLSSSYVRFLNKHTITKNDICLAINAYHLLAKLVNYSMTSGVPSVNSKEQNYEDDESESDLTSELDFFETKNKFNSSKSECSSLWGGDNASTASIASQNQRDNSKITDELKIKNNTILIRKSTSSSINSSSTSGLNSYLNDSDSRVFDNILLEKGGNINNNNSNEEFSDDASTICAESISNEQISIKYAQKVKELISEQNQHIYDLNILRRIFMYLLQKCCVEYNLASSLTFSKEEKPLSNMEIIESIFGNINDVYELALRLTDSLDDAFSSVNAGNLATIQTFAPVLVGEQFWDFAGGNEFDVYDKFASIVTKYSNTSFYLKAILNNPSSIKFLTKINPCIVDISKYLLPKLLLSPIYHFLYLYETVECLYHLSFEEEDKDLLKSTLDTLKSVKYDLNEKNFKHSLLRPVETSFRMFQSYQLNQTNSSTTYFNLLSANHNITTTLYNFISTTSKALASNTALLTEKKWKEIETDVEPFKLPQNINQPISYSSGIQLSDPNMNISEEGAFSSNSVGSLNLTINNAYLFEGNIMIYAAKQRIVNSLTNSSLKDYICSQPKLFKVSKRYAYLFDGLLILIKKPDNSKPKFKQAIPLDKCYLKDCQDEFCFEIQILNQHSSSSLQNQSAANISYSKVNHNNQEQEYLIFIARSPPEKINWMSMLCYAQYKFTIDRLLQTMTEEHNKNNPLPIPPKDYAFDEPDSPETILFEQVQIEPDNEEQNPYKSSSDGLSIKAATLIKLVERLTHHLYLYPKFCNAFLMCFREFCSTHELFKLLIQRFEVPDLNLNYLSTVYNFTR
jgi:hypothetical protein